MKEFQLQKIARLGPRGPFHFEGTLHKPSHFPAPVDVFSDGAFHFALRQGSRTFGIRLRPAASSTDPLNMEVYSDCEVADREVDALSSEVYFRFGMGLDLSDFFRLAAQDDLLAAVVDRWRGMRPSCAFSLYELLCITILLQNTRISRTVSMMRSLLDCYGEEISFAGVNLFGFWPASALATLDEAPLRTLKVGYRARSLLKVSLFFAENQGFESELRALPKQEAIASLRRIYGVGPATASYLLFESLKQTDAFDHVSPWEAKILSHVIFGEETVEPGVILAEAAKRWGNWRMLAVHYLFEDLFWRHKREPIAWLGELIRL